jgi:hypothetical protein
LPSAVAAPFANFDDCWRELAVLDVVRPEGPRRALPGFGCMDLTALLFLKEHTVALHKNQHHAVCQLFGESRAKLLERETQLLGHLLNILRGHIDILIPAMLMAAVSALLTFKIHFEMVSFRVSPVKRRTARRHPQKNWIAFSVNF